MFDFCNNFHWYSKIFNILKFCKTTMLCLCFPKWCVSIHTMLSKKLWEDKREFWKWSKMFNFCNSFHCYSEIFHILNTLKTMFMLPKWCVSILYTLCVNRVGSQPKGVLKMFHEMFHFCNSLLPHWGKKCAISIIGVDSVVTWCCDRYYELLRLLIKQLYCFYCRQYWWSQIKWNQLNFHN